jgi:hypothetical protein
MHHTDQIFTNQAGTSEPAQTATAARAAGQVQIDVENHNGVIVYELILPLLPLLSVSIQGDFEREAIWQERHSLLANLKVETGHASV